MKFYFFLASFFILLTATGFCQSLLLTEADSSVSGPSDDAIVSSAKIKNTRSVALDVRVKRRIVSEASGSVNYFCWASCYTAEVDVSPDIITINAGETADNFKGYYEANNNPGNAAIEYIFYVDGTPNDSLAFTVNYSPVPVGVKNIDQNKNSFSEAWPNPVSDKVTISYNFETQQKDAKIRFFNSLGSELKQVNLNGVSGSVEISLKELPSGVYYYNITLEGKITTTKKLVIR